jgi:hypothetical protein
MTITNQEIILAAEKFARANDMFFGMDYQDQDINIDNFHSIFLSKNPSQIEVDEEDKSDYPADYTYADVYNEIMRERRKAEYGTWEEQMEMQFDGTWEDHVQSVKDKYLFI